MHFPLQLSRDPYVRAAIVKTSDTFIEIHGSKYLFWLIQQNILRCYMEQLVKILQHLVKYVLVVLQLCVCVWVFWHARKKMFGTTYFSVNFTENLFTKIHGNLFSCLNILTQFCTLGQRMYFFKIKVNPVCVPKIILGKFFCVVSIILIKLSRVRGCVDKIISWYGSDTWILISHTYYILIIISFCLNILINLISNILQLTQNVWTVCYRMTVNCNPTEIIPYGESISIPF
jgi:hypothetical protein